MASVPYIERSRALRLLPPILVGLIVVAVWWNAVPQGGRSVDEATDIAPSTLEEMTKDLPFIEYVGSDAAHHYLLVGELGYYRVPITEKSRMMGLMSQLSGIPLDYTRLFVKIVDGEITTPDPKDLSEFMKELEIDE